MVSPRAAATSSRLRLSARVVPASILTIVGWLTVERRDSSRIPHPCASRALVRFWFVGMNQVNQTLRHAPYELPRSAENPGLLSLELGFCECASFSEPRKPFEVL